MSIGFETRMKARTDAGPLTIDAFRVMDQTPAHATVRLFLIPSTGGVLATHASFRPVSTGKQFDQIIRNDYHLGAKKASPLRRGLEKLCFSGAKTLRAPGLGVDECLFPIHHFPDQAARHRPQRQAVMRMPEGKPHTLVARRLADDRHHVGRAGAGTHRGGLGAVYEIELLEQSAEVFLFGERGRHAPKGAAGGHEAALNRFSYSQGKDWAEPSMVSKGVGMRLKRGDAAGAVLSGALTYDGEDAGNHAISQGSLAAKIGRSHV